MIAGTKTAQPRLGWLLLLLTFVGQTAIGASAAHRTQHGMVVTQSAIASDVGAEVLLAGGNAIDAAVATAFALAVTYPEAGNIGGGGFLVYQPHKGRADAYDFRETAPTGSHPEMWLDEAGEYSPARQYLRSCGRRRPRHGCRVAQSLAGSRIHALGRPSRPGHCPRTRGLRHT